MAITFSSPVVSGNSVTLTMTSDVALLSVGASDFSLRRDDTDAVIGSSADISVSVEPRTGSNYNWDITVTNSANYQGSVYIRARAAGFIESVSRVNVPSSNLDSSTFKFGSQPAPVAVAGTYYFIQSGGQGIAYDFDDSNATTRNSVKDRNFRTLVSGSDVRSATLANTPNGRRIGVIDNGSPRAIRVLNEDFSRDSSMDVTLRLAAGIYTGLCATSDGWVCSVWDSGTWRLEFYSYAGVEDTAKRQAPTNRGNNGLFADDTHIYIVSNIDDAVYRRTFASPTITSFIAALGTGGWNGGASTSDRFILVDSTGNKGVFYNHSGTLQSSEEISLPNAAYDAVLAIEAAAAPVPTPPSTPGSFRVEVIDHDSVRLLFTAPSETFTQIQYRYATSEAGLSSASWRDGGITSPIQVDGLPSNTLLYFQLRSQNGAEFSAGSAAASGRTAAPPLPDRLSIEAIDTQFILVGTEDYVLIIDVGGKPDYAIARGHMEGFFQNWDAVRGQLRIESEEVTRTLEGVFWNIEAVRGVENLEATIGYSVVDPAAILLPLPLIHLYRDVPINFDIDIQHIPSAIISDSQLVGIKANIEAYGLNFQGELPKGAVFGLVKDNIKITVPSNIGDTASIHEYPYQIEQGDPPVMTTPEFIPRGNYGELVFSDVKHAFGYEWTLGEVRDDTVWNDTRPVVDPGQIEVTPGNLQVTLKFPVVPLATSYQYRLDSETHTVNWTAFQGQIENGMVTVIIPNLEDGVEYDLSIRVGSPWVGAPVSIKVYGGRVCYTIQSTSSSSGDTVLYMFHTGHPDGTRAPRIKRMLLPSVITNRLAGLAVNSDGDVFVVNAVPDPTDNPGAGNDRAIYTFRASTIENAADNARLVQDLRNPFPSAAEFTPGRGNLDLRTGLAEFEGSLYTYFNTSTSWRGFQAMPVPTVDGAELTQATGQGSQITPLPLTYGCSVTDQVVWYTVMDSSRVVPVGIDRDTLSTIGRRGVLLAGRTGGTASLGGRGLKVIGNAFYGLGDKVFNRFRVDLAVSATRAALDFSLNLPVGVTLASYLDILV